MIPFFHSLFVFFSTFHFHLSFILSVPVVFFVFSAFLYIKINFENIFFSKRDKCHDKTHGEIERNMQKDIHSIFIQSLIHPFDDHIIRKARMNALQRIIK